MSALYGRLLLFFRFTVITPAVNSVLKKLNLAILIILTQKNYPFIFLATHRLLLRLQNLITFPLKSTMELEA